MGLTDSYAYFLPIHALYQIVSIKLCHNKHTPNCQSRKILSSLRVKTIAFTTRSSH